MKDLFTSIYVWILGNPKKVRQISLIGLITLIVLILLYLFIPRSLFTSKGTIEIPSSTQSGVIVSEEVTVPIIDSLQQNKISFLNSLKDSPLNIITLRFLDLDTIDNSIVTELNKYLVKNNINGLKTICKIDSCTLQEKMTLFLELKENIKKGDSVKNISESTQTKNSCSEKDILQGYNTKMILLRNKVVTINDSIKEWNFSSFSSMNKYTQILKDLQVEKLNELSLSIIQQISKSPITTKQIKAGDQIISGDYYNYNEQLYQKSEIDSLVNDTDLYTYISTPLYIEQNNIKYKYYDIILKQLKNKGILDTATQLLLKELMNNCDDYNLEYSNFEQDIKNNKLIQDLVKQSEQGSKSLMIDSKHSEQLIDRIFKLIFI